MQPTSDSWIDFAKAAFSEEARTHQPYEVEELLNSVAVWNMAAKSSDLINEMLTEDLKLLNIGALRILAANDIHTDEVPYRLYPYNVVRGKDFREAIRVGLTYNGPKLKPHITGIATKKEELRAIINRLVAKAVLTIRLQEKQNLPTKEKPVDVSLQTRFVKFIGKYTSHEMVFKAIPNKKMYGPIVLRCMPKMVDNIIVQPHSSNGVESVWKINAAGKPWLARIGRQLDDEIVKALGKR